MTDNKIDPSISRGQLPATDRSRTAGKAKAADAAGAAATDSNRGAAATSDTVRLTAASQRLADLESAVLSAPDVRSERVARLKQAIADGSYQPSAERIADRLLTQELGLLRGRG